MKKLIYVLALLLMVSPVLASVNIFCTTDGDEVSVYYSMDIGDTNLPRAFGLNITVDNDAIIGAPTNVNPNFWVYPGTIDINDVTGDIDANGTVYADPCDYPGDTEIGPGTGGMTVEMGSLYYPPGPGSVNEPPSSGLLCKFTVDKSCTVTIAENNIRGGVVYVSTESADPNFLDCSVLLEDCMKATSADYNDWIGQPDGIAWTMPWSKPDCWCYPRQCRGDADGNPSFAGVPIWVDLDDLNILRGAIGQFLTAVPPVTWPAGGECANFDHQMSFPGVPIPVDLDDLNILREYIGDFDSPPSTVVPCCDDDGDCTIEPGDSNYNFWTKSAIP